MPRTKNQVFRLRVIDELLNRKKWVKTSHIKKTIEEKLLENVSERTIQNDINAMKNDTRLAYYAPIEYNKSRGAYTYEESGFTINNFSLQPQEITALQFYGECLQSFSGYKVFDSFSSGLKKVINGVQVRSKLKSSTNPKTIIQTDTLVTPEGNEYVEELVYAIDNKIQIEICYLKYGSEVTDERILLPCFLKEYKNRWYLLAFRLDNKEIRTYALDRIKRLVVTDVISSEDLSFNPDHYFKHSFGITTPDAPVEKIILRFNAKEAPYIKSLPIHKTQIIENETDDFIDVSIEVILSYEVYEFILSKTPDVKVMSPIEVAVQIAKKLQNGAELYKFLKEDG